MTNATQGMAPTPEADCTTRLRVRRIGIDTYQESVVYVRSDSDVCRSVGFEAQSRVLVRNGRHAIVATLNVITADWLEPGQAGLSEAAWRRLDTRGNDTVSIAHSPPPESASDLRAKVYGHRLDQAQYERLLREAISGRLSDIELAAFVTACAGPTFDLDENVALTEAMVAVGERLHWPRTPVVDKHCVGGLPGNRTSPIVVAIVAAAGCLIPKSSSRAITSPAGTADTMATLTHVDLDLRAMCRVVERENGCLVWGGTVGLSPADDVLIRVERPLDFDSDAQLTASVLSKKKAAGSTHVLIDIPVGPTAKIRTPAAAAALASRLQVVAAAIGITVRVTITDGRQPVGRGIGPALEARDVLAVLRNAPDAPPDLRTRAVDLAAKVLDFDPKSPGGDSLHTAQTLLDTGAAWAKFQAICAAQGALREPPAASQRHDVTADRSGVVADIDNRRLAKLAKLAGAPRDPAAGVELLAPLGTPVVAGQPLLRLHADSRGEIAYARAFLAQHPETLRIEDATS
ncbi:MAG: putative thymidine phosphorylase DeoA [Rhodanobacteraceae bacterium]